MLPPWEEGTGSDPPSVGSGCQGTGGWHGDGAIRVGTGCWQRPQAPLLLLHGQAGRHWWKGTRCCSGSEGPWPRARRAQPHPAQGGTGEPVLCVESGGSLSWSLSGRGMGRGRGLSLSALGAVWNLGSSVLARVHPASHLAVKNHEVPATALHVNAAATSCPLGCPSACPCTPGAWAEPPPAGATAPWPVALAEPGPGWPSSGSCHVRVHL